MVDEQVGQDAGPVAVLLVGWNLLVQNPLNWVLLAFILWLIREFVRSPPPPIFHRPKEPVLLRAFTLDELRNYNGATSKDPIYMGVRGKVYDVTRGRNFYGPGGPYGIFAGRDASRGLAKNSFDPAMVSDRYDPLEDLTQAEQEALREWQSYFENKYDYIGWLVTN